MKEAYIYEAARTPTGKRDGVLSGKRADDLAADCLAGLVERTNVSREDVEDVIMGCVTQLDEQGSNVARIASLIAGFPETTCGTTVNRQCGSSLQALNFAAQGIQSGAHDLTVAAGVESMSRVPMGADMGDMSPRLTDKYDVVQQGVSAEMIAEKWELSRDELDRFGLESHRRAVSAIDEGLFEREIIPVEIGDDSNQTVEQDEGPRRDTSLEKMSELSSPFKEDGVITAGSSSQISDGAAALLIGNDEVGDRLGLNKRARIREMAIAGVDPTIMLTGPIPATRKVLDRAGLTLQDIELFEVNEAFASVVMAWGEEMPEERDELLARTNVNGGAIALGHPLGCSGARLVVTLLHEMERQEARLGLATLCIGFGQAVATIIERV